MLSAIQLNRTDFVELFMDHGVSLREFLTKKRLLMLYNKVGGIEVGLSSILLLGFLPQ